MILLSTSSLHWYWIHRAFLFAKKAWFDGIDLSLSHDNYDLWDDDYIKWLSDAFWIKVLSITAPSKWLDEDLANKIMWLSKSLWAQLVNFSPPYFRDSNSTWFSKYLSKIKKDSKISVAIKNVEPEFLLLIIPKYRNASLLDIKKITWDTSLDLSSLDGSSWIDIIKAHKILWNSIKNIYLSDKHWLKEWLLPGTSGWWISYLPLESFLMKLKTTWYNWFISLKVNPNELWVWNEDLVYQNFEWIIAYYKKYYLEYK